VGGKTFIIKKDYCYKYKMGYQDSGLGTGIDSSSYFFKAAS